MSDLKTSPALEYRAKDPTKAIGIARVILPVVAWSAAIICPITAIIVVDPLHNALMMPFVFVWFTCVCTSIATIIARRFSLFRTQRRRISVVIEASLLIFGGLWGTLSIYHALVYPDPHVIARNIGYCSKNLLSLSLLLMNHAQDNHGNLPGSLAELANSKSNTYSLTIFVCPAAQPMGYLSTPTTHEVWSELSPGEKATYVYLGKGLKSTCDPQTVLIYDIPTNHVSLASGGDGMHILRANGKIEWLEGRAKRRMIDELAAGRNPPTP